MALVILSSKGQIVIPKPVREAIGIGPGAKLRLTTSEGKIILQPLPGSSIDRLHGKFAGEDFLMELESEHREEVRDEEARA